MLSTSYKKAAELAHKSSKAALSLVLVIAAFLGFHTFTGNEGKVLVSVAAPEVNSPEVSTSETAPIAVAPVKKLSSVSRQQQIAELSSQLEFAKVELSAQVDLLNVIVETNVFGDETKSIAPAQIAALKAVEVNN
jgi:hypothetical protein